MIAVIKGDIIASRKLINPEEWLFPLKDLMGHWGETPKEWELVWGDFFQLEIANPADALKKALQIKALIKSINPIDAGKKMSTIDVRMAVGIGEKEYSGSRISESNGPAFINAGEKFEKLKKEKTTLSIQSPWPDFDEEINLYLMLANTFMNGWSVSSAQLISLVFQNPNATQAEIGDMLGIKQSSVSGRWNRAKVDELMEVEKAFRKKMEKRLL
jgi:DNA-directed RNA polymerase specialized sigma subunit